jgi:asparagine synthase (glutamine-hydrolysing)
MVRHSQINELEIFDKQKLLEIMRQHSLGIGDARSGVRLNSSLALIAWFEQIKNEL